ncbi:MAG: short-chain dehydrogenase [Bryobacterales bacterium]|nr:short-chain dehydrogenase [Bryobacterales bacterium]
MSFNQARRTILVTGATSGIGLSCAQRLAAGGARLVLTGRDLATLALAVPDAEEAVRIEIDLARSDAGAAIAAELRGRTITLDGAVFAAGASAMRPLLMESPDTLEKLWRVNFMGTIGVAGALQKARLLKPGASLVFFSSASARTGGGGMVSYAATKGAIEAAVRALAVELAGQQIRVNAVAPGVVCTAMSDRHFAKLSADQKAALEKRHPLGFGQPEDVAAAVEFLLQEGSRWITGSVLVVDGGYSIA